jgi:hypothetical protein
MSDMSSQPKNKQTSSQPPLFAGAGFTYLMLEMDFYFSLDLRRRQIDPSSTTFRMSDAHA